MASHKVTISCAVTGSIHALSMSPHLSVTSAGVAGSALSAAVAGAAIEHLHPRNPLDGRPDQSPEAFEPLLRVIKQSSNVVETNAARVTQVRKIIEGLGFEIASPDEARDILQLKGGNKVAFQRSATVDRYAAKSPGL